MSLSSMDKKWTITEGSDCHSAVHVDYDQKPQAPIIGYTEEELAIARNSAFWKPVRYSLILLFWLLWAGFLAGTTVIVVLNNGDVSTTMAPTSVRTTSSNQ